MAKGFPEQPQTKVPGVPPPVRGSLGDYLSRNFPSVYERLTKVVPHGRDDYKGDKFARKFPTRDGRVP